MKQQEDASSSFQLSARMNFLFRIKRTSMNRK